MSSSSITPINGTIMHSSTGSLEDIIRQMRNSQTLPALKDPFVHATEEQGSFPIPVAMPVVEDVVLVGTPSLQTQGFSTVESRRFLARDQVRAGAGHPAFVMAPV